MCFRDSASKVIVAANSLSQHRLARGSTDHGRRLWPWRAAQREKTIGHLQRKPSQTMNKNEQGRREDGGPHSLCPWPSSRAGNATCLTAGWQSQAKCHCLPQIHYPFPLADVESADVMIFIIMPYFMFAGNKIHCLSFRDCWSKSTQRKMIFFTLGGHT